MDSRQGSRHDASDPVSTWVDIIHPVFPENVELAVWSDDAVEEGEHDEEEREDVGDDGERRGEGADPLAPAGLEKEEEHCHEKAVAGG